MEAQEHGSPENVGIHTYINWKHYYTELAWHILTSSHSNDFKYEYFHDDMVEQLTNILCFHQDPQLIEEKCRNILGDEGTGHRVAQYYLFAENPFVIPLYKKRKKRNRPEIPIFNKKKEISFNVVGWELAHNFMRLTYAYDFPSDQHLLEFMESILGLSAYELEEKIDGYMTTDDEDDDDGDGFLAAMQERKEFADTRPAFITAATLLWKSKNVADLKRAVEVLENIENALKDEFDSWQVAHLSPEFHEAAEERFDMILWEVVFAIASCCRDEIYTTVANINDQLEDEDEMEVSEDLVVVEFFGHVIQYMGTSSQEVKNEILTIAKSEYKEMCQQIESDILGDFDDDTGEYTDGE